MQLRTVITSTQVIDLLSQSQILRLCKRPCPLTLDIGRVVPLLYPLIPRGKHTCSGLSTLLLRFSPNTPIPSTFPYNPSLERGSILRLPTLPPFTPLHKHRDHPSWRAHGIMTSWSVPTTVQETQSDFGYRSNYC
jgi:hypothetical protein